MFSNLVKLGRYRALIQTLVVRDLKARYRGSVLGFFWSFFNPALLLFIYTFVFTKVLPSSHPPDMEPFALFMFCGILPWTWFSSSLLESSNTLIAGGNLIKKVLFPAEVLPIVTVLANMVHFFLGLPILAAFVIYYQRPVDPIELLWFPVIVLVQLVLTTGPRHVSVGADRALPRLEGSARQHPDVVVLCHADHLLDRDGAARHAVVAQPQPDDAPDAVVPGGAVLRGPARPPEMARGAGRGVGRGVPGGILRVRSAARQLRGRSMTNKATETRRHREDLFGLIRCFLSLSCLEFRKDSLCLRVSVACREHRMTPAIDVRNVSKVYRRYARRKQFATLKSALLDGSLIGDLKPEEAFPALRGVSFTVPKGCTYGVIGRNGSGKSTLLKCVAGITRPTEGSVEVDGRISALIELGAGFHPEISGRENIFINGIMLGLTKKEVTRRFDEIVDFAEMGEFIDAPVKTYSSGMYMRLGFAVAIHVDPEVLLVDEVLAVGDQGFTHKCLDKFSEFRRRNKSILLVTHSLDLVEKFCDEAHWLDHGKTKGEGDPKRVVAAYVIDVEDSEENELAKAESARVAASASPKRRRRRPLRKQRGTLVPRTNRSQTRRRIRSTTRRRRAMASSRLKAAGARARSRSPR